MSYPYSSPLLIELTNKIKELNLKSSAQKWAVDMQKKYAVALIDQPCADLSLDEINQANEYLEHINKDHGLDLIQTFPRPEGDPHLAAVTKLLENMPVVPVQEPRIEDGTMSDTQLWQGFLRSSGEKMTFEDWSNIRYAYRRARERKELVLPVVKAHSKCLLSPLPKDWFLKLDLILPETDVSEVVVTYSGVEITRGDIATILPTSAVQRATPTNSVGWLNDRVIETFLNMVAAARTQRISNLSTLVVNSYVVGDLKATDAKASAKKVGIEAATLPTIATIFFPLHVNKNHWQLVVAFPKTRSLVMYDSRLTGQGKQQLVAVRDWIKAAVREAESVAWDMQEAVCPQQTDDSICGVFVCINALIVTLGGEPIGWYSHEDSAYLRRFVAAVICKGGYPYTQ